jgi:2'-5' RNA ligase
MGESAIVVPVPSAEPVVSRWRRRLDPSSRAGMPAHITLLYPFAPLERFDETLLPTLRELFASVPRFDFVLGPVGWFDGRVLFLRPQPADPFVQLTRVLQHQFPEYPPYGGAFEEVLPHLTVAEDAARWRMRRAASQLETLVPIPATASAVSLMTLADPRRGWEAHTVFTLCGPTDSGT